VIDDAARVGTLTAAADTFRAAIGRYVGTEGIRSVHAVESAGHILVLVVSRKRANALRSIAGAMREGWPVVYSARGMYRRSAIR